MLVKCSLASSAGGRIRATALGTAPAFTSGMLVEPGPGLALSRSSLRTGSPPFAFAARMQSARSGALSRLLSEIATLAMLFA